MAMYMKNEAPFLSIVFFAYWFKPHQVKGGKYVNLLRDTYLI